MPPTESNLHFPVIDTSFNFESAPYYAGYRPPERHSSLLSLATLDTDHEQVWGNLAEFYSKNEEMIQRSIKLDARSIVSDSDKTEYVGDAMDTFVETANVILDGLVALGNVHPILGVAIFAFNGVIKLDLARRDNNRKVLAVKLEMQNMMSAMFQLRTLRHVHVGDAARAQEKERLQRLIKDIAKEITTCGSDLNYYLERKFVAKLVNAKGYERRFADHVKTFSRRRSELQITITSYIAAGTDAANIAIAEVSSKIDGVEKKIDDTIALFRKMDTARERECLAFMETNGGPQACIATDDLLAKLISMAPDSSDLGEPVSLREPLVEARKSLTREISENLQDVLASNQTRFEVLLNVQNNNLKRISDQIEEQGQNTQYHHVRLEKMMNTTMIKIYEDGKIIKKAVASNSPVKLKDPELQKFWDRMGLKGSVKARQFVLTFRDYLLAERSAPNTPNIQTPERPLPDRGSSLFATSSGSADKLLVDDETELWVLKHIDVAHVQSIVEAMDEDLSGFISVKEANKFALSRPPGWSLLYWIAYWAAGWHINITDYRQKIYTTLQKLHKMVDSLHPMNKKFAYEYLDDTIIDRIEAILRPIRSIPRDHPRDPKLVEIATSMATLQEQRLRANLKEMSYTVQTQADVRLIAGSERVETWILPLLHLMLEHHLEIFKIAQSKNLHPEELSMHSDSLWHISYVFTARIKRLKEIFRPAYRNSLGEFGHFAYGMFNDLYDFKLSPSKNTLLSFADTIPEKEDLPVSTETQIDISILTKGLGDPLEYTDPDLTFPDEPLAAHVEHPIEGFWVVTIRTENADYNRVLYLNIGPVVSSNLSVKAIESMSTVSISGTLGGAESTDEAKSIDIKIVFDIYPDLRMKGTYDPQRNVVVGLWILDNEEGQFPSDDVECTHTTGTFQMTRTPPHAFRFRHLLGDSKNGEEDTTLNLPRRRWVFAIEAVRFKIQENAYSWKFMSARIAERKSWIEFSIRDLLSDDSDWKETRGFLSPVAVTEWQKLKERTHPITLVFYEAIALYLDSREWQNISAYTCNACFQTTPFARYFCITCTEDDFSNSIDFCVDSTQCIKSASFTARDFMHSISHTLLRVNRHVLNAEKTKLIMQCNLRSERIKRSFREREANVATLTKGSSTKPGGRGRGDQAEIREGKLSSTPLVCATCKKDLSLPCWACATCSVDILLCMGCEHKLPGRSEPPQVHIKSGTAAKAEGHSLDHFLLRIHDSAEAKVVRSKSSNKHLDDMNGSIHALKAKLDEQLDDMKASMNKELSNVKIVLENVAKDMAQDRAMITPFLKTRFTENTDGKKESETASKISNFLMTPVSASPQPTLPGEVEDTTPEAEANTANTVSITSVAPQKTDLESRLGARLTNLESKVEDIMSMMKALLAANAQQSNSGGESQ